MGFVWWLLGFGSVVLNAAEAVALHVNHVGDSYGELEETSDFNYFLSIWCESYQ